VKKLIVIAICLLSFGAWASEFYQANIKMFMSYSSKTKNFQTYGKVGQGKLFLVKEPNGVCELQFEENTYDCIADVEDGKTFIDLYSSDLISIMENDLAAHSNEKASDILNGKFSLWPWLNQYDGLGSIETLGVGSQFENRFQFHGGKKNKWTSVHLHVQISDLILPR